MSTIDKTLTISTGHILPSDRSLLEDEESFSVGNFDYGFFIFVPTSLENFEEKYNKYSDYFRKIVKYAIKEKCVYICFDAGIEPTTNFEWLSDDWG